ncbi:MAG TPA: hypothetical protein VNW49_18050 [Puia sp.]|nr:hypothetical protein [Puia sp.]
MTRFLIFHSLFCLSISCNQYRYMQKIPSDESCIEKLKPDFHHVVYKTSVDVIGKHISGLLVVKHMPDNSTRVVFTNEMGLSYFDFGFPPDSGFKVYSIIPQMNKEGLVRTLRKDFELLQFRNMDNSKSYALKASGLIYHAYPQAEGANYYITDSNCRQLVKMQRASAKKPIMEAVIFGDSRNISPDSISIRHFNISHFSITLKQITSPAAQ